jgi:hypothetical protein
METRRNPSLTVSLECILYSPLTYVNSFALLFNEDFELEKKKMLPRMKLQNGAQLQYGRQDVFIV